MTLAKPLRDDFPGCRKPSVLSMPEISLWHKQGFFHIPDRIMRMVCGTNQSQSREEKQRLLGFEIVQVLPMTAG